MSKFNKIYIEITNKCNLNCSFCSKSKRQEQSMTLTDFEIILSKIQNYTDIIYLHVKGEPLLHKDLIAMLKLCEEYHLKVNITTNGVLFPSLVKKLEKCKALNKIHFSLHSENTIPEYCEKIMNSVKQLSPETVVIYRLWTLKNGKFNKKSTEIVEKIINFYQLDNNTVEKLYSENNVKIDSNIYVDKDNEFEWPTVNKNNYNGYCHGLKTHIAILVDGTVVPCCLDGEGIVKLGNIFKEDLEEIINSKRFQKLKKSFQDRKPSEQLCTSCTFKK